MARLTQALIYYAFFKGAAKALRHKRHGFTVVQFDQILKGLYLQPMVHQLNQASPLFWQNEHFDPGPHFTVPVKSVYNTTNEE